MALTLRGAGAVVSVGEGESRKTYSFSRGLIPEDTPEEVLDVLRRRGAIAGTVPTALGLDATAPEHQPSSPLSATGGVNPAGPSIDVASSSVEQIAERIDSRDLNVSDTVALANDDPALAGKVLEAEVVASGDDPRKGVTDALTKIRDA